MKTKCRYWIIPLNGATINWQQNIMYRGGCGEQTKVTHASDGNKLYCIETAKNYPTKTILNLFKELFGVSVVSSKLHWR